MDIPYIFHIYFLNMFHIFSLVSFLIHGVKSRSRHDRSQSCLSRSVAYIIGSSACQFVKCGGMDLSSRCSERRTFRKDSGAFADSCVLADQCDSGWFHMFSFLFPLGPRGPCRDSWDPFGFIWVRKSQHRYIGAIMNNIGPWGFRKVQIGTKRVQMDTAEIFFVDCCLFVPQLLQCFQIRKIFKSNLGVHMDLFFEPQRQT